MYEREKLKMNQDSRPIHPSVKQPFAILKFSPDREKIKASKISIHPFLSTSGPPNPGLSIMPVKRVKGWTKVLSLKINKNACLYGEEEYPSRGKAHIITDVLVPHSIGRIH